jgi:hypothetical protein
LVDYRYLSAGPTLAFALDERDTLKALGSYGDYRSLNGLTASQSETAQLALVRQLNELWSLSTSVGYSRSTNSQKYFFGPFYLGNLASKQNGDVYAVNLSHQGEKFTLSGGVSRALQPTGLAYLSRQDSVNLTAAYTHSERWDFGLSTSWQKTQYPTLAGANSSVRYLNAQLTANWHWTSQWILSMHATRITQQFGLPTVNVGSSGLSLDISRQFLRTEI